MSNSDELPGSNAEAAEQDGLWKQYQWMIADEDAAQAASDRESADQGDMAAQSSPRISVSLTNKREGVEMR
jgi:hypothetical protein